MNQALSFGDFDESLEEYSSAKIAILPVPYDLTSTYHKGADKGPAAIIAASHAVESFDIETRSEVYRQGIATLAPLVVSGGPEELFEEVKRSTLKLIADNKLPVLFGGEHSVTPGAVAAAAERFENLSVLQLDAHMDTRDSYHGSKYNHACVMSRVRELCPYIQVGIRSMDAAEWENVDPERVFFAHDIARREFAEWGPAAIDLLSDNVYVTIDLDCFDPSIIPSTGTPEPGGLDWYQVTRLLKALAKSRNVVGFDVVELLPRPSNPAPDFIAAKLTYQFLSYIFAYRSQ